MPRPELAPRADPAADPAADAAAAADEDVRRRRVVFDQLGEGLFVLDEDREVVEANLAFCQLVGRDREEVLRLHPWDWDERFRSREDLLRQFPELPVSSSPRETRLRRADGSLLEVETRAHAVSWHGRRYLLVTFREIGERKRLEEAGRLTGEALAAQVARLESILAAQTDGIFVVDREQRVQDANRWGRELLGFDPTGLTLAEIATRMGLERVRPDGSTVRALQGDDRVVLDFEYRREGERRHVTSSSSPMRNARGEVIGAVTVLRDITGRVREQEDLRALAARLQTIREEEQKRIARDLHDDLGQLVTALKMDLRWIERRLADQPPGDLLERAVAASELADQTVATLQRVAAELRPSALAQLGLGAALGVEARRFRERTGVPCALTLAPGLPELAEDAATALYRIAQEALTNVARHAGASAVAITLEVEQAEVRLTVADDGQGFDAEAFRHSLGLLGMRERAAALGGQLELGPAAPHGALVRARVPLARVLAHQGRAR